MRARQAVESFRRPRDILALDSDARHDVTASTTVMQIQALELSDLPDPRLCSDLIEAWALDDRQWGATLNGMLTRYSLRNTIVAISTIDWRFTWAGPGLVFLDPEPERLYGRPLEAVTDRRFLNGVMQDLVRATAQPRPTISKIITPLNDRIVQYKILSLPDWERRNDTITGCTRIPFDLTVYGQQPALFNAGMTVPNTVFAPNGSPTRSR